MTDRFGGEPGGRLYRTGDRARFQDGRHPGVHGPPGRSGENPGAPYRTGRNRSPRWWSTRPSGGRRSSFTGRALMSAWWPMWCSRGGRGLEFREMRTIPPALPARLHGAEPSHRARGDPPHPDAKFDRNALPDPEAFHSPDGDESFVAPRTTTEEALARIWAEVRVREGWGGRRFLCVGGSFSHGYPGHVPGGTGYGGRATATNPLRGFHRGRTGGRRSRSTSQLAAHQRAVGWCPCERG